MASAVSDPVVAAAIDEIDANLDVLLAVEWLPSDCDEAMVRVREYEALSRRLHAVTLRLLDAIGRSGVSRADGHASAKVMVRHGANLSNAQARRRDQVVRMQREMPAVAAGHAAGRIGVPQVERIARTWANARVRDQLVQVDAQMARAAAMLPYREFDEALTNWERLADEDGAGDRAERNDANRDFRMPHNLDGSGRFEGGGGSLDTQIIEDIWQRQVRREWEADWAEARCRLGDGATTADLVRTDGQRRFDAMKTCMVRGDLVEYGVEARTCTDLVQDVITFERYLAKIFGTDPGPDPRLATWWDDLLDTLAEPVPSETEPRPESGLESEVAPESEVDPVSEADPGAAPEPEADPGTTPPAGRPPTSDLVGYRCGTIDGRPLDPAEVVVATLIGQVRRVVTGADSVVLDMGRRARCFTGARQLAVRLSNSSCVWTGCDVPSSECQCDHLDAFNGPAEGRTHPGNGAPQCGPHNRFKEGGFTVVRDRRGRWHVFRPDGTEIT
ncbi:MAG TPA: DUF222 domain-containing protein [Acidimicrobiales bacterium]|nr:DUF222 domain-containing protein [Acidimicrobiales bacterium]